MFLKPRWHVPVQNLVKYPPLPVNGPRFHHFLMGPSNFPYHVEKQILVFPGPITCLKLIDFKIPKSPSSRNFLCQLSEVSAQSFKN